MDAGRQEARLRQGGGRRPAAVHRHPQRADARRRRPARHQVRRAGRLGARRGRLHRRDQRGDAGQARLLLRGGRALRAPRVPRARTTPWSTPRRTRPSGGMVPIVCVGEGLEVRQAGDQVAYTLAQVDGSLAGFSAEQVADLVVAYEPVWAIGTGEVATPDDAQEVCAAIRARLAEVHGAEAGRRSASSTAARSRRRTSAGSWPRPTSTAAWSAGRPAGGRVRRHLPVLRHASLS